MVINSEKTYSSIESQIDEEFIHISDFIWKSNRLTLQEKEREEKIYSMYEENSSNDMIIANLRWEHRGKLTHNVYLQFQTPT